MLIRINFLLGLVALICALFVVHGQYESRLLYTQLDKEVATARQLQVESDSLLVMLRAQAAAARVNEFAQTQLHMHLPTPAVTRYLAKPQIHSAHKNAADLVSAENTERNSQKKKSEASAS